MKRRRFLQMLGGIFPWAASSAATAWTSKIHSGDNVANSTASVLESPHGILHKRFDRLHLLQIQNTHTNTRFFEHDDFLRMLDRMQDPQRLETMLQAHGWVKLTTLIIAGLQYGDLPDHPFLPGERLVMMREPHNAHDPYAVAIRYAGMRVGYIPRTNSRIVASLMDAGVAMHAFVRYHHPEKEPWERVWVSVWMVK